MFWLFFIEFSFEGSHTEHRWSCSKIPPERKDLSTAFWACSIAIAVNKRKTKQYEEAMGIEKGVVKDNQPTWVHVCQELGLLSLITSLPVWAFSQPPVNAMVAPNSLMEGSTVTGLPALSSFSSQFLSFDIKLLQILQLLKDPHSVLTTTKRIANKNKGNWKLEKKRKPGGIFVRKGGGGMGWVQGSEAKRVLNFKEILKD
jgi:hypothetical protein